MQIRKSVFAAALLTGMLALSGCSVSTPDALLPSATDDSADAFAVDIQVPYVTNAPTQAPAQDNIMDDGYISISADGKVTVLKDSWDDYVDTPLNVPDIRPEETEPPIVFYTQLRVGDSGENVEALQSRLAELGYYTGEISGYLDGETQKALMTFEAKYSDECYGIATARLQQLLFASDARTAFEDLATETPEPILLTTTEPQPTETEQPVDEPFGDEPTDDEPIEEETPEPTETPEPVYGELNFGDTSDAVLTMQQRLEELGYLEGEPTGEFDYYTACAVMRFEAAYGRTLTGIATESMQTYLYKENAIALNGKKDQSKSGRFIACKKGKTGADIVLMQQRLVSLGYSEATPNGKLNDYTIKLLKQFQKNMGVKATGKADEKTLKLLYGPDAARAD